MAVITYSYEWELHMFGELTEKQFSEPFECDIHRWRLLVFPRGNAPPHKHMSLFLEYLGGAGPEIPGPKAGWKFIIKNHEGPQKDFVKATSHTFTPDAVDWGYGQMMPLEDINTDTGFLREDGALVVRVELSIQQDERCKVCTQNLTTDLLALLEDPAGFSDVTLVAAGGRSFPAHRAILAARCEYFRALFAGGFADSAAKELPLPDTDPDALRFLLRYLYGGILHCPPQLLKPTAELADRWLLTEAREALHARIGQEATPSSLVDDLLWAESRNAPELAGKLEAQYVKCVLQLPEADLVRLAGSNPQLATRLQLAVARAGTKAM